MLLLRRKALHLLPKNTLFTMKGLIYCFCAVLILASCRGGKKTEVTVEDNDSLAVAPDSSETDSLPANFFLKQSILRFLVIRPQKCANTGGCVGGICDHTENQVSFRHSSASSLFANKFQAIL